MARGVAREISRPGPPSMLAGEPAPAPGPGCDDAALPPPKPVRLLLLPHPLLPPPKPLGCRAVPEAPPPEDDPPERSKIFPGSALGTEYSSFSQAGMASPSRSALLAAPPPPPTVSPSKSTVLAPPAAMAAVIPEAHTLKP